MKKRGYGLNKRGENGLLTLNTCQAGSRLYLYFTSSPECVGVVMSSNGRRGTPAISVQRLLIGVPEGEIVKSTPPELCIYGLSHSFIGLSEFVQLTLHIYTGCLVYASKHI